MCVNQLTTASSNPNCTANMSLVSVLLSLSVNCVPQGFFNESEQKEEVYCLFSLLVFYILFFFFTWVPTVLHLVLESPLFGFISGVSLGKLYAV